MKETKKSTIENPTINLISVFKCEVVSGRNLPRSVALIHLFPPLWSQILLIFWACDQPPYASVHLFLSHSCLDLCLVFARSYHVLQEECPIVQPVSRQWIYLCPIIWALPLKTWHKQRVKFALHSSHYVIGIKITELIWNAEICTSAEL